MSKTFDEQVEEVLEWYKTTLPRVQMKFKNTPRKDLVKFHNTLGRNIRNKLNLWKHFCEPEIVKGVDTSKNHPDAISMKIIEAVWEKVNEKPTHN